MLTLCVGCASDSASLQHVPTATIDTIAGVLEVNNRDRPMTVDSACLELTLGTQVGDSAYEFGQVWDIDVDRSGTMFVLDLLRRQILRYDIDGVFLGAIGGMGDGPGEFRVPMRLTWIGETLAVWDRGSLRLTRFTADGHILGDSLIPEWRGLFDLVWDEEIGFLGFFSPSWQSPPDPSRDGIGRLVRMDPRNAVLDTLHEWRDSSSVSYVAPGVSRVASVPFAARPTWTPSWRGGFFFTPAVSHTILEFDRDGDLVRRITTEFERQPLRGSDRDSAVQKVEGYAPELRNQVALPDLKPALGNLRAGVGGSVLLAEVYADRGDGRRRWDVFDGEGRLVGRIGLPVDLRVEFATTSHLYGVRSDSLGVSYVQRYRLPPCGGP